ncbi:MAG: c-type cytochrome [Woeseiaceae bacterium]
MLLATLVLSACGKASQEGSRADPNDAAQVALGAQVYAAECATCHGLKLEGQPNWRKRLANGRMPAPPHDESGHTWHHPDRVLFAITRNGLVPPYAPKDYESDMPAFGGKLADDEIWAVLAYLKSHWTLPELLAARAEIERNAKD